MKTQRKEFGFTAPTMAQSWYIIDQRLRPMVDLEAMNLRLEIMVLVLVARGVKPDNFVFLRIII